MFDVNNSLMIIGEKESFFIRVLLKKLKEQHVQAFFCPAVVNKINSMWGDATLVSYYMDSGENISTDVIRFLIDKMTDDGRQMLLVGDTVDMRSVMEKIPGDLILKSFARPLDNDGFVVTVKEIFGKIAQGDFKKSILIVDDDPSYVGLVREWLKTDYKVSMAASGLQAIKWLVKNKVDLILLDFEMPVTSGPQVLEMLRSEPDTSLIPVIFLTGKGDKESVMEVVALKPEGYLLKTITKEKLLNEVNEFFAKRGR
jgi:CheY-like chemotaxis protein